MIKTEKREKAKKNSHSSVFIIALCLPRWVFVHIETNNLKRRKDLAWKIYVRDSCTLELVLSCRFNFRVCLQRLAFKDSTLTQPCNYLTQTTHLKRLATFTSVCTSAPTFWKVRLCFREERLNWKYCYLQMSHFFPLQRNFNRSCLMHFCFCQGFKWLLSLKKRCVRDIEERQHHIWNRKQSGLREIGAFKDVILKRPEPTIWSSISQYFPSSISCGTKPQAYLFIWKNYIFINGSQM